MILWKKKTQQPWPMPNFKNCMIYVGIFWPSLNVLFLIKDIYPSPFWIQKFQKNEQIQHAIFYNSCIRLKLIIKL